MFKFHEKTRKRLCRAAFFACAVLPTAAVLAWGVSRHLPGHAQQFADELSTQLALDVKLAGASHPRPGVLLLTDVTASDPESGLPLLKCGSLEVECAGQQVTVTASLVEIEASRAELLWQLAQRRLRQQLPGRDYRVTITADPVTWNAPRAAQSFIEVLVRLGQGPQGCEADISFRLAGAAGQEPAQLRIVRHRKPSPATAVTFNTGGAALPCSVFSPLADTSAWLGTRAQFNGLVWVRETPAGWDGELTGQLSQLDLDTLVSGRFPHVLRGAADLRLERAKLIGGRITEAAGALRGTAGQISASLLAAGCEALHLEGNRTKPASAKIEPYDRLALDFIIEPEGLTLLGRCGPTEALLVRNGEALWKQPPEQPQPVVALVRALVPANEVQVPAAVETDLLLRHLPLAPIKPPLGARGTPAAPHARLRVTSRPTGDH
jgi:hypothetical protein